MLKARSKSGHDGAVGEGDSALSEFNELLRTLEDADDRGLVLSLAAFAEDALGEMLRAHLLECGETTALLDGFNAPLGSLSSRIKVCRAVGLISHEQCTDLEHLRKMRNHFAHQWKALDLSSPSLANHITALRFGSFVSRFPETPTDKVRGSITSLLSTLGTRTRLIAQRQQRVRSRGGDAFLGFEEGLKYQEKMSWAREQFDSIINSIEAETGERQRFQKTLLRYHIVRVELLDAECPAELVEDLVQFKAEMRAAALRFNVA